MDVEKLQNEKTKNLFNEKIRNSIAFWIFGICTCIPFCVMLSAAEDIIKSQSGGGQNEPSTFHEGQNSTTECTPDLGKPRCEKLMSTGAVLLADIVPELFIKSISAFFVHRIPFCFRNLLVCLLQVISFLVLAFSTSLEMSLIGVMFTSAGGGFGELCYLTLSSFHDKSTFTGFAAGAGFGAIVGSFTYSALTEPKFLGLTPQNAILVMLVIPAILFFTFCTVLVQSPRVHRPELCRPSTWIVPIGPKKIAKGSKITPFEPNESTTKADNSHAITHQFSLAQKLKIIKSLLWIIIPMFITFLLEFLMGSGLIQHVKFDCEHGFGLSIESQFRWFQTIRMIGGFLPKLVAIFMEFPNFVLYLITVLQALKFVILYTQALFGYLPHISAIFAIIFMVGLESGCIFTFVGKVHRKASPESREFKMTIIAVADTFGIVLAGFVAIWLHNHICQLYPIIYQ